MITLDNKSGIYSTLLLTAISMLFSTEAYTYPAIEDSIEKAKGDFQKVATDPRCAETMALFNPPTESIASSSLVIPSTDQIPYSDIYGIAVHRDLDVVVLNSKNIFITEYLDFNSTNPVIEGFSFDYISEELHSVAHEKSTFFCDVEDMQVVGSIYNDENIDQEIVLLLIERDTINHPMFNPLPKDSIIPIVPSNYYEY